jgi:predicted SnoaL-like aldol condensation-catalyzing enzyme
MYNYYIIPKKNYGVRLIMKKSKIISILIISFIIMITGCKTFERNQEKSKKEKVIALLEAFETGDSSKFVVINPQKYIQHNLAIPDGLKGFLEFYNKFPKNSIKVNIYRAFEDGNYVFTHSKYDFLGQKVIFNVFRFENNLIVEHWNGQTSNTQLNPSGHSQLDGELESTDLKKTEKNRSLVSSFIKDILIERNLDLLSKYISAEKYIQHNSNVGDGLQALEEVLIDTKKTGIKMIYKKNHKVLAEGNFVLSMSEGTFSGKEVAFYDLFRVEDLKIVEHWDVMEEIPPRDRWANKNGKF